METRVNSSSERSAVGLLNRKLLQDIGLGFRADCLVELALPLLTVKMSFHTGMAGRYACNQTAILFLYGTRLREAHGRLRPSGQDSNKHPYCRRFPSTGFARHGADNDPPPSRRV